MTSNRLATITSSIIFVSVLAGCMPLPDDGGATDGTTLATTATEPTDLCEMIPGQPFGPCADDGTCAEGFCVPALDGAWSVCVVPCSPGCAPESCSAPIEATCNNAGACSVLCDKGGQPAPESCADGQVCVKPGDTAPWTCAWPKG